jgi:hypothetical protein
MTPPSAGEVFGSFERVPKELWVSIRIDARLVAEEHERRGHQHAEQDAGAELARAPSVFRSRRADERERLRRNRTTVWDIERREGDLLHEMIEP